MIMTKVPQVWERIGIFTRFRQSLGEMKQELSDHRHSWNGHHFSRLHHMEMLKFHIQLTIIKCQQCRFKPNARMLLS